MTTICQKCGDMSFSELLIYCQICMKSAEHMYYMDKIPETSDLNWSCEQCRLSTCKIKRERIEVILEEEENDSNFHSILEEDSFCSTKLLEDIFDTTGYLEEINCQNLTIDPSRNSINVPTPSGNPISGIIKPSASENDGKRPLITCIKPINSKYRSRALLRYREKKARRHKQQRVQYTSRQLWANTRDRAKGRFMKSAEVNNAPGLA